MVHVERARSLRLRLSADIGLIPQVCDLAPACYQTSSQKKREDCYLPYRACSIADVYVCVTRQLTEEAVPAV